MKDVSWQQAEELLAEQTRRFAEIQTSLEALALGNYDQAQKTFGDDDVVGQLLLRIGAKLKGASARSGTATSDSPLPAMASVDDTVVHLSPERVAHAILVINRDGTIESSNAAIASLLGYTPGEVIGHNVSMLMGAPHGAQHDQYLARYCKTGETHVIDVGREVSALHKNGDAIPIRLEVTEISADSDRKFVGTMTDLRPKMRAAEALNSNEMRFRALFEQSEGCCMILEPTASGIPVIVDANEAACRTHGYTREEMIGKPVVDLNDEAGARLCRERTRLTLSGKALRIQNVHVRKDGSHIPMVIYADLIQLISGKQLIVTTEYDVSKLAQAEAKTRALEQELAQVQKMEAVGQLASGVAHDFNNLLMGITGCTSIAMDSLDDPQRLRVLLDEVRKSALSGAAIVKQLLTFARKSSVQAEILDLHAVVSETEDMLRRLLGADIDFVVVLGASRHHVCVDRGQLEQMLMNLAVNARDAMHLGGKLVIETATVSLDGQHAGRASLLPSGEYVALRFADTGCGMSEEIQERIFEPFFTTKEVGKGTGLGLATVFGIVKQAGGQIEVQSDLGKGTTFEILLPCTLPPASKSLEPLDRKPLELSAPTRTVLLVEDEPTVRMTTRYYLEAAGYGVLEASTGSDAMDICRSHSGVIDILLTDMVLPGLNGAQVAQQSAALRKDMRVVFTSAHDTDWLVAEGRLPVGARSLQKPFTADDLVKTLRDVLPDR